MPPPLSVPVGAGLTITNPLVLYRTLLATKKIDPDPAQHRLALELQKLYYNLKDYSPQEEYKSRLKALNRVVNAAPPSNNDQVAAVPGHGLRRNPLFARLFAGKERRDTLALTKVLLDHEEAMSVDSPKGMLLHGEVGCGKSMLLNILADSLPNRKKGRWHFNTFMLDVLAQLESLRVSRSKTTAEISVEHSLLSLAKDLVDKSPILFLDEFQLPDRATSKILSNLFTVFFQLGGVLIASSNRLPDELAKASGVDYSQSPKGFLGFGKPRAATFPANQEYARFVDVLKARCEVFDLTGRDWRRREAEQIDDSMGKAVEAVREEMVDGLSKLGVDVDHGAIERLAFKSDVDLISLRESILENGQLPKFYVLDTVPEELWTAVVQAACPDHDNLRACYSPSTLSVYGRKFVIPRQYRGICYWTFEELCAGLYGPADYITLTSTFHTIILDHVPVLTLSRKNEARRLITLLDALYEARCKVIIRAAAGPDDLFFPETKVRTSEKVTDADTNAAQHSDDAVYPETLAEIYQDQTSPFRPNISTYAERETKNGYDPDEDSDFGPITAQSAQNGNSPDFGQTSSFTGEDEKFAYKRARSRLWQLCSASWMARSDSGWWAPVPTNVRRWESSSEQHPKNTLPEPDAASDVRMGGYIELENLAGLQGIDQARQGSKGDQDHKVSVSKE